MKKVKEQIDEFSTSGQAHLNAGTRMLAGLWALVALGGVGSLVGLIFVVRGHRVPLWLILFPLTMAVTVAVGFYLRNRYSRHQAVCKSDHFFELNEGLITADEHIRKNREEEIHRLQLEHTQRRIKKHDPSALRLRFPRKLFGVAFLLVVASVLLWMKDDSLAVQNAKKERAAIQELSKELEEELSKELEDLKKELEKEAAELVKDPVLKKMLKEFPKDGDRKTVMRRLSEIDLHLAEMQASLDTRADENYLKELAAELSKSRETAALGKALNRKKYKQASKELKKMKLSKKMSSAERKRLSKMASTIEKMDASMNSNKSASRRSAREMSKQIQKMNKQCKKSGKCSNQSRNSVNKSLSKSGQCMEKLSQRRKAKSALSKLRRKLQQSQKKCSSCNKPSNGSKPGTGLKAGDGVNRSRRDPSEKSPNTGNPEHLTGILNEGDSEKEILNASSGTGSRSGGGTKNSAAGYKHQLEAFVEREDVPEEMKFGVKKYFDKIHRLDSGAETTESGTEKP